MGTLPTGISWAGDLFLELVLAVAVFVMVSGLAWAHCPQ